MSLSEKLGSQPDEFLLFLPMHRMNRTPEPCSPSRLNLNENQHAAVLRHEIQFAERRTEVFGDNPVAFPPQITFGLRLSFLPKEMPGVKNCHTLVRCMLAVQRLPIAVHALVQSLQPRAHRSVDG